MGTVVQTLKSFNKKERFLLVADALGFPLSDIAGNRDLRLCDDFRSRLNEAFGICPPSDAFVAIDYHLDWISKSLVFLTGKSTGGIYQGTRKEGSGTIMDVNLLVAFEEGRHTHLMLVDAKAATDVDTEQAQEQVREKVKRLLHIFGENGKKYLGVRPHFGLTSPSRPTTWWATSREWPSWMAKAMHPIWFPLNMPRDKRKLTRCNSDYKPNKDGDYFCVDDPCH